MLLIKGQFKIFSRPARTSYLNYNISHIGEAARAPEACAVGGLLLRSIQLGRLVTFVKKKDSGTAHLQTVEDVGAVTGEHLTFWNIVPQV